jgi:hypothetical protein
MDMKKNATLIIGISIPIIMVILVALSIYVPTLFMHPQYNFLYLTGEDYYSQYTYSISGNTLTREVNPRDKDNSSFSYPNREQKIYLYDINTNESREVSYEEARRLVLDSSEKSPDGYEVTNGGYGDGFFPFFIRGSHSGQYIKNGSFSKKLNTQLSGSYYYNFHFLGWIRK